MTQLSLEFARTPIPTHPNYSIDRNGTVYGRKGKPMIGDWIDGYRRVQLGSEKVYVHRLVLLTFVGSCPGGYQARHKNSDRADNRLSNLVWGSRKQNAHDRQKVGSYGNKGLSTEDKQRAQALYEQGYTFKELKKEFNCDGRTLRRYARKYDWQRRGTSAKAA